jgi:predicted nicotinamide N-methyase
LLALYILSLPTPSSSKKVTVLDLGSGIGFLPLCLRSKGYEVIATDIPEVIESVLGPNVDEGLKHLEQSGGIEVIPLDWETVSSSRELPVSLKGKKIDIITTTDTLYAPHLLEPLLVTLRLLSTSPTQPMIYVGLERRDPGLIDGALEKARDMGLSLNRVDKGKIDRLMEDDGWEIGEWDDVEIWKGKFTRSSIKARIS